MTDFVIATCSRCFDELLISEHALEYRRFPFVCPECTRAEAIARSAGATSGSPGC